MTLVSDARAIWLGRNVLPHEPALRAWLRRQSVPGLDVDDIVQESYAALVSMARVDHIANPKTYLFQVAKSVVLMHLRRSRVVSIRSIERWDETGLADPDPSPETQAGDRESLHHLATAIAGLPAKCREAFTLRRVEGLSQREVADRMGVSENTVEKHVGKAIRHLMDTFGRGGKQPGGASKDSDDQTWSADVAAGDQFRN